MECEYCQITAPNILKCNSAKQILMLLIYIFYHRLSNSNTTCISKHSNQRILYLSLITLRLTKHNPSFNIVQWWEILNQLECLFGRITAVWGLLMSFNKIVPDQWNNNSNFYRSQQCFAILKVYSAWLHSILV